MLLMVFFVDKKLLAVFVRAQCQPFDQVGQPALNVKALPSHSDVVIFYLCKPLGHFPNKIKNKNRMENYINTRTKIKAQTTITTINKNEKKIDKKRRKTEKIQLRAT